MGSNSLPLVVQDLVGSMETLAAIAAHLRIDAEQLPADHRVAHAIAKVVSAAGVDLTVVRGMPKEQKLALAATIRALFRQAGDLADCPDRSPGWGSDDPVVLQGQGQMSIPIAATIQSIASQFEGFSARLSSEGARFLDVGTGVAWLAIALARTFPKLAIVGLDVSRPALALAKENVGRANLADRIELREESVTDLRDERMFDAAFTASPFLPKAIIPAALERIRVSLRPGGLVYFGVFATVSDPRAIAAQELRAVRAGGYAWPSGEASDALRAAGFTDVREVERTWQAPVGFVVGRRTG